MSSVEGSAENIANGSSHICARGWWEGHSCSVCLDNLWYMQTHYIPEERAKTGRQGGATGSQRLRAWCGGSGGGLVGDYLWFCGALRTLRHTGERQASPSHCHQDDFSVEKEDGWCLSSASDTVNLIPCKRAKSLQWLIVSMINCLPPIPKLIFISTILSSAINIFHFALRLLIKPVQHLLK